ncbi:MAG: hypothetical protein WA137_08260 [Methanothrix sp.]
MLCRAAWASIFLALPRRTLRVLSPSRHDVYPVGPGVLLCLLDRLHLPHDPVLPTRSLRASACGGTVSASPCKPLRLLTSRWQVLGGLLQGPGIPG